MPILNGQYRRPQLRNAGINYCYGWFFVTCQVAGNKSALGAIVGDKCVLNPLGEAVASLVSTLGQYNPGVHVDSFAVMPNHVHLVLKIDDIPGNDGHNLGKVMRKFKSLASREYRLQKERGLARDIGSGLWQENYWEKIVTGHGQLEAIRRYMKDNPKNWSVDRFGPVTSHSLGNLELLNEPFEAFVASQDARGDALAPQEWSREKGCFVSAAPAAEPRGAGPSRSAATAAAPSAESRGAGPSRPAAIISTFTSPQEREVLRRIVAKGRRFIAIYPGGIPQVLPPEVADAVGKGRALLLSPVPGDTGVNKQRAVWCNEYAVRRASRVWCGHIAPGGTLHSILRGLDK